MNKANSEVTLNNLNHKIEAQVQSAMESARKAGRSVNSYAKEKPWQFAGLALTAGFLAGWLLKKKD
ncbi:MAG: hypothetical protein A2901_05825 [Elusimicrobia bacterium RIFCSPLOWO2_01_FULL_54_10]|nr:MAG: hypothetical protein A2901_05825 [Elusimicrobia bacterium RIFCSPLOWO2_01_FULL_54_10]